MRSEAAPLGTAAVDTASTAVSVVSLSGARRLTNRELVARVKGLAADERRATAILIAHLAVLDERQLYLEEGASSLFAYLTQFLHLSEHAAYGRIQAARAARRYPLVLDLLADGSVTLTAVTLLAPELTPDNHRDLLAAVTHKSRRQVEEIIARLRPRPPARSLIRRLPAPSPAAATTSGPILDTSGPEPAPGPDAAGPSPVSSEDRIRHVSPPAPSPTTPPASRRAAITPLAEQFYRVQFTASPDTHAKLRAAQDLLRHQIPDGDVGKIVDRALTALLNELMKRKLGAADRAPPRPGTARTAPSLEPSSKAPPGGSPLREPRPGSRDIPPGSRYIPPDVRRAVWLRDEGRCTFTSGDGHRCTERGFLEFHHIVPFSAGGRATVDNLQLRCRAHNRYEAEVRAGLRGPPP
ncbi:MAG: HNH endonuclease signature motif containing protein [Armatimonadota bacterium]|nr:HNH endonuclease signature motif containing protein [Armatimonadota bacterium]MDR7450472.1 HNH endonuclease signature motif containing protein [Armatimonadota bacterium]MDR7466945.1 HNH endonuclease signature motif containing protein [Armatimonadota bacterium]MDR7493513.1 HNH endonuclease signature motif containing protein [Armatimonadota bacterium]MDR7498778.1 HNH endonuclease signature motif containing protein [Armatimonadota bacterium]